MSTNTESSGPSSIPAGTRFGSYEILEPIGAGGMGVVYRARDVRLGRLAAIKTLPASYSSDPFRLLHFEQEARALSFINHPNIVTLYALGEPKDFYYIVMEFVEGETLRRHMSAEKMRVRAILNIGTQVASALSAAHCAGVLHSDIKPENVMVRPDGLVKVLDFGLAKLIQKRSQSPVDDVNEGILEKDTLAIDDPEVPSLSPYALSPYVTLPNPMRFKADEHKVLGTVPYMSPERLRGQTIDARADIFSLGVLLYELSAGVVPFGGRSHGELIDAVLKEEPVPLSRYRADIPFDLEHIIAKALRKDRDRRYQHIKDLLIDLQDIKQEREFEETLKRSVQYESIDRIKVASGSLQTATERVIIKPVAHAQRIARRRTRNQRLNLSKVSNQGVAIRVEQLSPGKINLFLTIAWRRPVKPRSEQIATDSMRTQASISRFASHIYRVVLRITKETMRSLSACVSKRDRTQDNRIASRSSEEITLHLR